MYMEMFFKRKHKQFGVISFFVALEGFSCCLVYHGLGK